MKAKDIKDLFSSLEESVSFFESYISYLGCVAIRKVGGSSFLCETHNREQNIQINSSLSLYDYRTGESFDIFDYLLDKGIVSNFKEAVETVASWIGYNTANYSCSTSISTPNPNPTTKQPYKEPYSEKVLKAVKWNALKHPKAFQKLLQGLLRGCNEEERAVAVKLFSIGLNIEKNGDLRLFIPEFWNGKAYNAFRYNRSLDIKGKRGYKRKINLFMPKNDFNNSKKPIILAEGHSDCIVLNAKGIDAVSTGSATQKLSFEGIEYLKRLKRVVHIYPDADIAGLIGGLKKAHQLKEAGVPVKIFWWAEKTVSKRSNAPLSANKLLLEDKLLFKSFKKLPPEVKKLLGDVEVLIKSKPVKQGYDFIDFIQDFEGSKAYKAWIKRYVS